MPSDLSTDAVDILIVGAGPVGLALCGLLSGCGLTIAVIDKANAEALQTPRDDGREIAVTRRSLSILQAAGIHLPTEATTPLNRVVFHVGRFLPSFSWRGYGAGGHAAMVHGAALRQAAFRICVGAHAPRLLSGCSILGIRPRLGRIDVALTDGRVLTARLLIGADSIHSIVRRLLKLPCRQHDSGRAALLCHARLSRPINNTAHAWPFNGGSLYISPLRNKKACLIITGDDAEIESYKAMTDQQFGALIQLRSQNRLGDIQPYGPRNSHRLTCHWTRRFIGPRCVLLGEAAVGLHPITAQGLNLALTGVQRLAAMIKDAAAKGHDIGDPALLARYDRAQRRISRPWYLIGWGFLVRRSIGRMRFMQPMAGGRSEIALPPPDLPDQCHAPDLAA